MKVYTIEIANVIEKTFLGFLRDWGGEAKVRFTRFIDLGGKQTDLYLYPNTANASPWLIVRVKSVYKSEQGECMQYFVELPADGKTLEDVLVSPENWKIPALADKILEFAKNDLLVMINQISEDALLGPSSGGELASSSTSSDEDLDDFDTSGILAGGDDSEPMDFDPEAIIRAASDEDGGGDDKGDDENNSDFNPEDIFKD